MISRIVNSMSRVPPFLLSQLLCICVLSAQPQYSSSLTRILDETQAVLVIPDGFRPVSVRENPNVRYDFAFTSTEVKLEMRILLRPLGREIEAFKRGESSGPDPNSIHEALLLTICLNLSGGVPCEPTSFDSDDVHSDFNADAGATTFVRLNSEFGRGFNNALINVFHRDDVGDIFVFFLFDDFKDVGSTLFREDVFHAVKFK
ncbi:MAG: hypothetical protein FJ215_09600 [Ignavibacteria bacterium]|nr:hypothetical protein [Ignavibacteria bacterium]